MARYSEPDPDQPQVRYHDGSDANVHKERCPLCGRWAQSLEDLKGDSNPRKFLCPDCGEVTIQQKPMSDYLQKKWKEV
jgi:predicted RNA-binding Zn-ribbon protein involved in translation (DUF1610 family)